MLKKVSPIKIFNNFNDFGFFLLLSSFHDVIEFYYIPSYLILFHGEETFSLYPDLVQKKKIIDSSYITSYCTLVIANISL